MAKDQILIDWPLTPYTGWGSYGIQLAQALIARNQIRVVVSCKADRSPHCDPIWISQLDAIEEFSKQLIKQIIEEPNTVLKTNSKIAMCPIGNLVPPLRIYAEHQVGVAFFERSSVNEKFKQELKKYSLIITGSKWNQKVLRNNGVNHSEMVHQGVDRSKFNSVPIPKLLNRPFVIFAGGKLEARKGQDIVIEAFKRFNKYCPNSILIACWGNIGNVGLNTISTSKYVTESPLNGDAKSLFHWLIKNEITPGNIMVPEIVSNAHLPNIMKQADVAVFTSRCEGGTNLMAMETLACGIPTLISANTGHLDLIEMGMDHLIAVGSDGVGKVPALITADYGGDEAAEWGETNPDELVECWLRLWKEKEAWREKGIIGAKYMNAMSWHKSMNELIELLESKGLCKPNSFLSS